jgi:hypothetical protein
MCIGLCAKYPGFNKNVNFSQPSLEKYSNIKSAKLRLVGAELFHDDGQTERRTERHDKANSRLSQFFESAQKFL